MRRETWIPVLALMAFAISPAATLAGDSSMRLYPSIGGLMLGKLPLDAFEKQFGNAPVNKYSDAFLHENIICYENKHSVLELDQWQNDGIVYDASIIEKAVFVAKNKKWKYKCRNLKQVDKVFRFDSGLSLGMTRSKVRALLGRRADQRKWGNSLAFTRNADTFVYGGGRNIGADRSVSPDFDYRVVYNSNGKAQEIIASTLYFD